MHHRPHHPAAHALVATALLVLASVLVSVPARSAPAGDADAVIAARVRHVLAEMPLRSFPFCQMMLSRIIGVPPDSRKMPPPAVAEPAAELPTIVQFWMVGEEPAM